MQYPFNDNITILPSFDTSKLAVLDLFLHFRTHTTLIKELILD